MRDEGRWSGFILLLYLNRVDSSMHAPDSHLRVDVEIG